MVRTKVSARHDLASRPKTKDGEGDQNTLVALERRSRLQLAACYRIFARRGMDDLIFTHLSVRLPGKDHRFLLNPFGYLFDEITASSLIAVDAEGHAIEKLEEAKINNAGFTIHSAVHMARDDAQCVMHSHTTAGMAVAAQEQGLLPLNQMSEPDVDAAGVSGRARRPAVRELRKQRPAPMGPAQAAP